MGGDATTVTLEFATQGSEVIVDFSTFLAPLSTFNMGSRLLQLHFAPFCTFHRKRLHTLVASQTLDALAELTLLEQFSVLFSKSSVWVSEFIIPNLEFHLTSAPELTKCGPCVVGTGSYMLL